MYSTGHTVTPGAPHGQPQARRSLAWLAFLILPLALSACAYGNAPLTHVDPTVGYRETIFAAEGEKKRSRGLRDTWLVVGFSGGGTRAAAFAYGVLEELAATEVMVKGQPRRLVDEIDVVSGVSGGSFTASYYALYGNRIFEDYETRFLKHNVQGALIFRLLWPWNWFSLLSPYYSRSDLAINYYDEHVFDGATFADLEQGDRPVLRINATDLSTGNAYRFSQDQFDFICSDLSSFPVARAVGASAAVPMLFPPVTLRNYAGSCGFGTPPWLERALKKSRDESVRRWRNARVLESYLDAESRPYIHLIDGGISDNLALRSPLDLAADVTIWEAPVEYFREVRHVVLIAVNAQTESKRIWSIIDKDPAISSMVRSMTNAQIDVLSAETLDLAITLYKLLEERTANAGYPTHFYFIEVTFQAIEDDAEREHLNSLPTSLWLPDEEVDRLRNAARVLLRRNPQFQRLLQDLAK